MPNSLVVIQARQHSTRLPNKVLLDLCGKPVLQHCIERCREADIGKVIIATGDSDNNAGVLELADILKTCTVAQTPEDNVHDRFITAVIGETARYWPDYFLRVTADSPLVEPTFLRMLAAAMEANPHAVYANLTYMRSGVPEGLGAEAFRTDAFLAVNQATLTTREKEHLECFLRPEYAGRERLIAPQVGPEWQRPYRLTLDTQQDLDWLRFLVGRCGMDNRRIIEFLDGVTGQKPSDNVLLNESRFRRLF